MTKIDKIGKVEGATTPLEYEGYSFDAEDLTLIALLRDPIYMAELLWEDPENREYTGMYKVRDYQYPLFRAEESYAGFACARTVGKTESIKARAQSHAFKRIGQSLLLTAPELIHLLPLTDAIEDNIRGSRLSREFLDLSGQRTGFTHRPFGVNFSDGTKIVGRIPKVTGTGVKGQHQPDLIVDEAQDYPERGWSEVTETVMAGTVDHTGEPDFHFHFYGVHSGDRGGVFYRLTASGAWKIRNITAIQRHDWGKDQKEAKKSMYGGSSSSDYRRNILGEAGSQASAFFVLARLMACTDQDRESDYNTMEYLHAEYRAEELDVAAGEIGEMLDLPSGNFREVYCGMDVGLAESPTVLTVFARQKVKSQTRLKLVRRITLQRFRTRQIREVMYAIARHFGVALKGFGVDSTGIGYPILQEIEDDESVPPNLKEVLRGYFFNAKVAVGVEKEWVTEDNGVMRDHMGAAVVIEEDALTGIRRYVTHMPMIEASTRYLREYVDTGEMMLPFDPEIIEDMQAETQQRVRHIAGMRRKPNAFHILDSMRAMGMTTKTMMLEEALAEDKQESVLDSAGQGGPPPGGAEMGMDLFL